MSGSNHERPFAPAQLDVLEDALELPAGSEPTWPEAMDDGMRSQVRTALRSYGAIGIHARSVLLSRDPPAHLLRAMIAQAHADVARPAMPDVPVVAPTRSWWSRRAAWLVPSLGAAVAATAVVIVVTQRPQAESASTVAMTGAADRGTANEAERKAEAKSESAPLLARRDVVETEAEAGRGAGLIETAITAPPPGAVAEPTERAAREAQDKETAEEKLEARDNSPDDDLGRSDRGRNTPTAGRRPSEDPPAPASPKKPSSRPGGSAAGGNATPQSPEPSPEAPADPAKPKAGPKPDAKKDSPPPNLDDRLANADAARERGDCESARRDYDSVIGSGSSRQRARARAGKALCLERAGDDSGARKLLDQARTDDPSVDAWVDQQR